MRYLPLIAVLAALLLPATAGAYAVDSITQTTVRVSGLACGTKYRVRVERAQGTGWTALQTFTPTTAACDTVPPPTAVFTMTPSPGTVGQAISLNWTGTCTATPCSVNWENEGTDGPGGTDYFIGTSDPQSYTSNAAGTKVIHLVVTDAAGQTAEARQNLTVQATAPPPNPQCNDGQDNDSDGKTDYPADPGCSSATDNSESPDPTQPPPSSFPDASNTGVPAGTNLTAYTGSCTITTAGTVIDSKTISCPGSLLIHAANVTVKNSKVTGHIVVDTDANQSWSLTLTDSEVDAGDGDLPAIYNGNVTILRANLHGGHNGLECQEHSSVCSLHDSWIHDQWQAPTGDTHLGGFLGLGSVVTCAGPSANGVPACVDLNHNTVVCDAPVNSSGGGCTGDINLINHFGPLHGALIQNNYLGANIGASFCTYGSAGFEYPADHIVYRNNVFARGTNGQCAAYGPVTNFDVNATGNEWTNNLYTDGGVVQPAN